MIIKSLVIVYRVASPYITRNRPHPLSMSNVDQRLEIHMEGIEPSLMSPQPIVLAITLHMKDYISLAVLETTPLGLQPRVLTSGQ